MHASTNLLDYNKFLRKFRKVIRNLREFEENRDFYFFG